MFYEFFYPFFSNLFHSPREENTSNFNLPLKFSALAMDMKLSPHIVIGEVRDK